MPNRLSLEASPYLRQHADNPVDWLPVGRGGLRAGARSQRADPPVGRICGVSLVPRDGARVVRGSQDRRPDERALRQHQGRSAGAARCRRGLSEGDPDDGRVGRMAADGLPDAAAGTFLRGDLFSAAGPVWTAGLCARTGCVERCLEPAGQQSIAERGAVQARLRRAGSDGVRGRGDARRRPAARGGPRTGRAHGPGPRRDERCAQVSESELP